MTKGRKMSFYDAMDANIGVVLTLVVKGLRGAAAPAEAAVATAAVTAVAALASVCLLIWTIRNALANGRKMLMMMMFCMIIKNITHRLAARAMPVTLVTVAVTTISSGHG